MALRRSNLHFALSVTYKLVATVLLLALVMAPQRATAGTSSKPAQLPRRSLLSYNEASTDQPADGGDQDPAGGGAGEDGSGGDGSSSFSGGGGDEVPAGDELAVGDGGPNNGDGGQDNGDADGGAVDPNEAARALAELLIRDGLPQDPSGADVSGAGGDVGGGDTSAGGDGQQQGDEASAPGEDQAGDVAGGDDGVDSGAGDAGGGQGDTQVAGEEGNPILPAGSSGDDAASATLMVSPDGGVAATGEGDDGSAAGAASSGGDGGGGDAAGTGTSTGTGTGMEGGGVFDDTQWPTEEALREQRQGGPISNPELADTPAPARERYKTVGERMEPPVLIRFDREPAEELQCVPADSKVAPVVERLPYHEPLACFEMTPAMAALLHMRPDRNADDNVLCVKRTAIADAVASGADSVWKAKGFSADPNAKTNPGDQAHVYDLAEFIPRDMATWSKFGVTPTALEQGLLSIPGLLLVKIVKGRLYMHAGVQVDCHRGAFLLRGLLEMLAAFADNVPDVLFLVTLSTRPVVPRDKFTEGVPPPVFSPAGSSMHFDIPFPMWNFWGDLPPAGAHAATPSVNGSEPEEPSPTLTPHVDPPWDVLMPLLREMSHSIKWEKKIPQALWRAPAYSSPPELPPVPMPNEPARKRVIVKRGKKIYPPEVFGLHHEVDAMLACVNGRFPELSVGVVDTYDSMHHVERDMIKKVQHGLTPLTPTERCRYRYLLYLERPDGLDPVTLLQSLGCESVLMMPLPEYFTFFSRGLEPGKHFVQLPYSRHSICAAVRRQVAVFNNNPANGLQLAANLRAWVLEHLNMGNIYRYMVLALQRYAQLQRFRVVLTDDDVELTPENLPEFVAPCQG